MNTSRSFDRAADFYDRTRSLPEPVATRGIQALLEMLGPTSRLLEVGAGTGRISVPLLQRGIDLFGCDLSRKMLARLHEKSPAAPVAQADASQLPFPSRSFDHAMTVHVLHLIPGWRNALREIRRVLKPEGAYLNVRTWASAGPSIREEIRLHWRAWLAEQGHDARLPGLQQNEELSRELESMGAKVSQVEILRYTLGYTLRAELERFQSRIFSDSWDVPDALFDRSLADLRVWIENEYGDLDKPHEEQLQFAITLARFR